MSHSKNDNHSTNQRSRAESASDFSIDLMPVDKIVKRSLHTWSVHHSLTTSNWIATLSRPVENSPSSKTRHAQFVFCTEREARKFCHAYAPPKLADHSFCQGCRQEGTFRHCRNCGVNLCDACSTKWGLRMIPKTYLLYPTTWVRVCRACDWLSNAFCMALLQGRYEDAIRIHSTGNVNLRTSFADIRGEACFPIHCAVIGGNLELVKWMVEGHLCPISATVDPKTNQPLSVQTSERRTLMDLAMSGKPKYDILTFLTQKGLSITDAKNSHLAPRVLESLLKSGITLTAMSPTNNTTGSGGPSNIVEIESQAESILSIEDACHICFERQSDVVFTPCVSCTRPRKCVFGLLAFFLLTH